MLFKNFMRPAYATAGGNSSNKAARSEIKKYMAFAADQSASDDINAFGNFSQAPKAEPRRQAPPPPRNRRPAGKPAPKGQFPLKSVLLACGALVAVVLVIVILVAIFSAPQKDIKAEDNAYFAYADSNGKYHVVSNGKTLNNEFEGTVKIQPALDYSFAYVFEEISNEEGVGTKIYILEGTKLEAIEALASKIIDLAALKPGIVYKEAKDSRVWYYSDDDHAPITKDSSADNFMISDDGTTVVYTIESQKDEDVENLKYFRSGVSIPQNVGPNNFEPVNISNDGSYVYGLAPNGALYYLHIEKGGEKCSEKAITNNKYGEFGAIVSMNARGDEIIFYTESEEKGIVSFMYKIKDTEPKQIAEGLFTPVYADAEVVCPETFLNSYFVCQKSIADEEGNTEDVTWTYFLDKDGARKMANTTGKFSPDGKYFYYIDEDNNLVRITLSSDDFAKSRKAISNDVTEFAIIESGDIFISSQRTILLWDCSSEKNKRITFNADEKSMALCGNSLFFTETDNEDVLTVYFSQSGAAKEKADFKSAIPTATPKFSMGIAEKGYAYFTDENGNTKLFYTSNGKKFELVADTCTIDE